MNYHDQVDFREEERKEVSLPVTLRVGWGGSLPVPACMVDLSRRGLRLCANIPFRLRQNVIAVAEQGTSQAKSYRVVWTRQLESGPARYEAGLELLTELTSAGAA